MAKRSAAMNRIGTNMPALRLGMAPFVGCLCK